MQGLMMHCGAEAVPFPSLMGLPIPGKDFIPTCPFHITSSIELAQDRLLKQGYAITNPQHFLNREAAHYFGTDADPDTKTRIRTPNTQPCAALRNSHDKTFIASLALGAKVFICDNLSFSGDIVVGRKHTPNIWDDLPEIFEGAIKKVRVMRKRQDVRFREYREAPLDDHTVDHLIMETYREGIINLKRIGRVT